MTQKHLQLVVVQMKLTDVIFQLNIQKRYIQSAGHTVKHLEYIPQLEKGEQNSTSTKIQQILTKDSITSFGSQELENK